MLLIDVSYDKEIYLFSVKMVRIKPKYIVKKDEICTYKISILTNLKDKEKREIDLNLTLDYPYGNSLELCNYVLEKIHKLNTKFNINDFINFDEIRINTKTSLVFDININREKTIQLFTLEKNKKINKLTNNTTYNLNILTPYENIKINLNKVLVFNNYDDFLILLEKSIKILLEENFNFDGVYSIDFLTSIEKLQKKKL